MPIILVVLLIYRLSFMVDPYRAISTLQVAAAQNRSSGKLIRLLPHKPGQRDDYFPRSAFVEGEEYCLIVEGTAPPNGAYLWKIQLCQ